MYAIQIQSIDISPIGVLCIYCCIDYGRQLTKAVLRKSTLDTLVGKEEEDAETAVSAIMLDETQKIIGEFLEALKRKKQLRDYNVKLS